MNNATTFSNALAQSFGTGVQIARDASEAELRKAALKRQIDDAEAQRKLTERRLKLQEEMAASADGDRKDAAKARVMAQMQAAEDRRQKMLADVRTTEANRDPMSPANQERAARAALLKAQTEATAAKPSSPIAGQVQGVSDFSDAMASAMEENQAALAAAQAGEPGAAARVARSQLKISGLQQLGQNLVRQAKPTPEPMVTLKRVTKDEDGVSENHETVNVPVSQWNEQNPLWGRFNKQTAQPGAAPAGQTPASAYLARVLGKTTPPPGAQTPPATVTPRPSLEAAPAAPPARPSLPAMSGPLSQYDPAFDGVLNAIAEYMRNPPGSRR